MLDEVIKIKDIFNSSRESFASLYTELHVDFTDKVGRLADKTTSIDEVRELYER